MAKIPWTLADMPRQDDRRFLITGANSGIGYITALELARAGATVLMACRDRARGEAALARIQQETAGAGQVELLLLDLASLADVRRVAGQLLAAPEPLHGLINNAGVFAPPKRRETADGFELQFGTNVLAHFALTCLLMPLLELGSGAVPEERPRVVTVASIAHKGGRLDFDDLQKTRSYAPQQAYQQSKLADLMFAFALQRHLHATHRRVVSLAVHPGVAQTALFKIGSGKGLAGTAEKAIAKSVGLLLNDDAEGALPTLFAATAPEAEPGAYYGPQGFQEMRGGDVGLAKIAPQAADVAAQDRLWQICEQLTGTSLQP